MSNNYYRIQSWKYFFVFSLIFGILNYSYYLYFGSNLDGIEGYKIPEFHEKYSIFLYLVPSIITLIFSYFLAIVLFFIKKNRRLLNILIYLITYGLFFILAIQLIYFEPKYTNLAIYIINNFAYSLLYSSLGVILGVMFLSFFSIKKN